MIFTCPFCQTKAAPGAKDCAQCGKRMTRVCDACAETVAANATSCKYCGEALPGLKEPARPAPGHPGIVFLEDQPRKRCCAARGFLWVIVLALAGLCAYSAVKAKGLVRLDQTPAKQQITAPKGEWH